MRDFRNVLLGVGLLMLAGCSVSGGSADDLGTDTLEVEWAPNGTTGAFTNLSASSTSLQPNLGGATTETVEIGGDAANPTTLTLAGTPSIVANTIFLTGGFVIGHNLSQTDETYNTFTDFMTALSQQITPSSPVLDVEAMGQYLSASNQFSANAITVLIQN